MLTKHTPLIALAALAGCTGTQYSTDATNQGQPVAQFTEDTVKKQDLTGYSFFDGKLVIPASAQGAAFSPYDTPVLQVNTSLGKYVGRGAEIIKLTIPGADAAAAAAKANVNSAQQDLSAQRSANSTGVTEAERLLTDARSGEKAARDAIANGGQADLESATAARKDAELQLQQAKAELNRQLQPNKEYVNSAAAALASAKADAARGIVRAPISGTIVALEAKPGMMAASRQALATIINFDMVRVQGMVPPELKDQVVKGSRVIIAMNGINSDPLDGMVVDVNVAPPAEGQTSPGYLAVIRFLSPNSAVQPNTSVRRIGVKSGFVENAMVVPVGAIITRDSKSYVNKQSGGTWVETLVETGITDGALIEIKSGLSEGDKVRVLTTPKTADAM